MRGGGLLRRGECFARAAEPIGGGGGEGGEGDEAVVMAGDGHHA